ncbi:ferrochelatase [Fluviispira multicolorata]|uniref:Ferrochelatase n=1 Tax=Fluviispira multicolorata TaxID=2654512 RepID=A0A833N895_9BACT|nr:ferrochelatase [Fluviispira multicolorata]KAB8033746.1 ferrochelatase [Fluviispira multicolorata]
MNLKKRTGVLLVNVGTPDSPEVPDVRKYLREFLSDPRVIDISAVGRFLLLNFIILPFRTKKSSHAYKMIWKKEGSPLLIHGKILAENVGKILGDQYEVEFCMRYQNPSIEFAIQKLIQKNIDEIIVFPLFPQYSSAATGSVFEKVGKICNSKWNIPKLKYITYFYNDKRFLESFYEIAKPQINHFRADFVLFSYHGLPERHVKKSDTSSLQNHCLTKNNCCESIQVENKYCYRAQCYETTRSLVKLLQLTDDNHMTSFQSRLGRDPWIKPYTDLILPDLVSKGAKRIAVMCPAFVADCLETLEEIQMRAKEQWLSLGGEDLVLVTSLNSHAKWSETVADIIREA